MLISILVDLMNLQKATEGIHPETIIGEIFQKALSRGEIHEVILFVPCYQTSAPWQMINNLQRKYSVQVVACTVLKNGDDGWKDTVDLQFLLWVMRHVHQGIGPDMLVFVTGDGHYTVAAREAEKKGKEVKFWFVKSPSVSGLIRQQEQFREIVIAPPSNPVGKNPFVDTMLKLVSDGDRSLSEEDRQRMKMMSAFVKADLKNGQTREELIESASKKLGFELADTEMVLEALMVADVARIYPAMSVTIALDLSSGFSQWISGID